MLQPVSRRVIGSLFVDLLKFLKNHERTSGCVLPLSTASRATLDRRVLISEWVPLEVFHELLEALDAVVLKGDEQRAIEVGALGGATIRGLLKAYSVPGDPASSVLSMRHAWRAHYDFGRIASELMSPGVVRFTVTDYPDMTMVHGTMTAGWGVAAARAAGAADAGAVLIDCPWRGAPKFTYEISF